MAEETSLSPAAAAALERFCNQLKLSSNTKGQMLRGNYTYETLYEQQGELYYHRDMFGIVGMTNEECLILLHAIYYLQSMNGPPNGSEDQSNSVLNGFELSEFQATYGAKPIDRHSEIYRLLCKNFHVYHSDIYVIQTLHGINTKNDLYFRMMEREFDFQNISPMVINSIYHKTKYCSDLDMSVWQFSMSDYMNQDNEVPVFVGAIPDREISIPDDSYVGRLVIPLINPNNN